jgi:hypothetical protein
MIAVPLGGNSRCGPRHVWLVAAILAGITSSFAEIPVEKTWDYEYPELETQIAAARASAPARRERLTVEALDRQAIVLPEDKDPLDIVLRRTDALVRHLAAKSSLPVWRQSEDELDSLRTASKTTTDPAARRALFMKVCALRRRVAFSNPLLDFDRVVCMLEDPGDLRIVEQARAKCAGHSGGGGPILLSGIKGSAACAPLLKGAVATSGPAKGRVLAGVFSGLELGYDGKEILFSATTDASNVWHLFRYNLNSQALDQLTDGPHDDFDPCPLPSGRIAFVSTRRGGIGRCFLNPLALTYTMFSMEADGSDIVCLSFHETNEWQPSVNNDGKIVYTRWDYVDRHWGTAHHFWESFPDGRDPRNLHGNYPLPFSTQPSDMESPQFRAAGRINGRFLRPDVEISFRAVPGSSTYTATAVGHHQGFSGSLVLLDPRIPDDGKMSQLRRITPEYPFPEVEGDQHPYGTAWPLSEDFYLCNYGTGLYLLDRFGNRELIYDPGLGPLRVRDPFPLRARPVPPILPVLTWQGARESLPDHHRAVVSVMNVYETDAVGKLPEGVRVKWLRVVQLIPQLLDDQFDKISVTQISFATDSLGRMALGVVPVEEDGSAHFEAPVGKALYFQLLDEKGMAVHSMRSATYVHPGEHLSCIGCHEDKWSSSSRYSTPLAMRRAPSRLTPEVSSGAMPFNYVKLVKEPVFDRKCVECHRRSPKAPDMTYDSLARHDLLFSYEGEPPLVSPGYGGSRTSPGHTGAMASGFLRALRALPQHRELALTGDDLRRITLWLDLNSNEIGWVGDDRSLIAAQKRGEALWPPIDVDPANPTGVEVDRPVQ